MKKKKNPLVMFLALLGLGALALITIFCLVGLFFSRSAKPAVSRLPTLTPTSGPPTATVDIEELKAAWKTVDIRDLAKNPDGYNGQEVHHKGEVFTIQENNDGTIMQVWVSVPGGNEFDREAVIVTFNGRSDNVYEGSLVEFWGYSLGSFEGTNAFGGNIRQPLVHAEYMTYFK